MTFSDLHNLESLILYNEVLKFLTKKKMQGIVSRRWPLCYANEEKGWKAIKEA